MVKGSEGGLAGSNSVHLDEHGYGFARAFSSLCSTAIGQCTPDRVSQRDSTSAIVHTEQCKQRLNG